MASQSAAIRYQYYISSNTTSNPQVFINAKVLLLFWSPVSLHLCMWAKLSC